MASTVGPIGSTAGRSPAMMRRTTLFAAFLLVASLSTASAQVVVVDPATTLRNSVTAAIKELVLGVQRDQHRQLEEMARRLSAWTNLDKYALPDQPGWRT